MPRSSSGRALLTKSCFWCFSFSLARRAFLASGSIQIPIRSLRLCQSCFVFPMPYRHSLACPICLHDACIPSSYTIPLAKRPSSRAFKFVQLRDIESARNDAYRLQRCCMLVRQSIEARWMHQMHAATCGFSFLLTSRYRRATRASNGLSLIALPCTSFASA